VSTDANTGESLLAVLPTFIKEVGLVGRTVLPIVVESSSACFFANLITDPAVIASVDFTCVSMFSPSSRSFTMLCQDRLNKLADKDALNAFLEEKDGIVCVLPMFVGLKGSIC
jgi:hypothetical protein